MICSIAARVSYVSGLALPFLCFGKPNLDLPSWDGFSNLSITFLLTTSERGRIVLLPDGVPIILYFPKCLVGPLVSAVRKSRRVNLQFFWVIALLPEPGEIAPVGEYV